MNMQQKILVAAVALPLAYGLVTTDLKAGEVLQVAIALLLVGGLVGGLLFALWRILFPAPGKPMFCPSCGHEGPSKQITKGSTGIELVLWLLFLVPGLIYSIWRHTSRQQGCAECGSATLIPPNSPMALRQKESLKG